MAEGSETLDCARVIYKQDYGEVVVNVQWNSLINNFEFVFYLLLTEQ